MRTRVLLSIALLLSLFGEPVGAEPAPSDEVRAAAHYAANEWGIDEAAMLRVAWCESRYDPNAENRKHIGLWQHRKDKWGTRVREFNRQAQQAGIPTMTGVARAPIDNARVTARMVKGTGGWSQWSCKP